MGVLQISANRAGAGNTCLIGALLISLADQGKKVAYYKPFSTILDHDPLGQWLGFLVLDGIAWPLALFGRTGPRAAFAKARGMLAGLFGHRVSARDVQRYVP